MFKDRLSIEKNRKMPSSYLQNYQSFSSTSESKFTVC